MLETLNIFGLLKRDGNGEKKTNPKQTNKTPNIKNQQIGLSLLLR